MSVITPTCDRPFGFALTERFLARQTVQPDEWIVADGGRQPATCTRGQRHVYEQTPPGALNFARNVLRGLESVQGDIVAIMEDDDWYHPTHLAQVTARLADPHVLIAGDDDQRYYNVARRCWRVLQNKGGCFCQTAFKRVLIPQLRDVIHDCIRRNSYGIDTKFWATVPRAQWSIAKHHTVVGIKGLPGQVGLGIGHRPDQHWTADTSGDTLRAWVGEDAALYDGLGKAAA